MTIQAVNQTLSASVEGAQESSSIVSLSLADKAWGLASHLFDVGKQAVLDHPWVALSTVVGIGVGVCFFTYNQKTPPPSVETLLHQIEPLLNRRNSSRAINEGVVRFVEALFQSTDFREQVGLAGLNPELQSFLVDKVKKIVLGEANLQSKIEMVSAVLTNFSALIETAQERVNGDVEAGRLEYLEIGPNDRVSQILPLGDETHNGGKIPLRVVFESGRSVVYKPRSMLPEKVICDAEEGVLRHEGFGTYRVVTRADSTGKAYGYSDFVQNRQGENTVSSRNQLETYVTKIFLLEQVAQRLGLSDLHYLNVITDRLNPCIIDAEVFLNPPHISSGLLDQENGPLHQFDGMNGMFDGFVGKNKIWFAQEFTSGKKCDFKFGMSQQDLLKVGVDIEKIERSTRLKSSTESAISEARAQLKQENGRFILIETPHLTNMQSCLDHNQPNILETVVDSMRDWVNEQQGFSFNSQSANEIIERLRQDILNHDVLAFNYNSQKREILYHDVVIGRQNTSSSSSSSNYACSSHD